MIRSPFRAGNVKRRSAHHCLRELRFISINLLYIFTVIMSKIRYKYCIVPYCKSTTIKTPQKMFFSVPVNEERRREWCLAMGRVPGKHKTLSVKCSRFVCEDHFDLEEDMENYMMWKMLGVGKLLLKKAIVPHKLECQLEKRNAKKSDKRPRAPARRANRGMYHAPAILEAKNRNSKLQRIGLYNIEKENNDFNHQDLEIAIKTEVTESICVSEQEPKTVVKNEGDELEKHTFTVRYDIDTGGEYLI